MTKNKLRSKNKGISILLLLAEFFCVFVGCSHISDSPSLQDPIEYTVEDTRSAPIEAAYLKEIFMDYENTIPEGALEWIEYYNEMYGENSASDVILTEEEVASINREIIDASAAVYEMEITGGSYTGDEVRAMIEKYSIPSATTVRLDGSAITYAERKQILANRGLESIPDEVEKRTAVIISRCSLRALPTNIGFYNAGDTYFDKIQETELIAGFPVFVLHESFDGEFLFVESYYYRGWVSRNFVAYCGEVDYALFTSPEKYVTVTSTRVFANGAVLDMGARIPYISEESDKFYVYIPNREDNGTMTLFKTQIPKSAAVYKSLPLTMENYYAQAFKYLGTDYGWGGDGGNVDCSGYVCAVMRSFGLYLPRNTGDQATMDVLLTPLSGTGDENIKSEIEYSSVPTAIYRPGHVMLYLGTRDGVIYIIHAPTGGDKVKVAPLTYISNITGIRQFK